MEIRRRAQSAIPEWARSEASTQPGPVPTQTLRTALEHSLFEALEASLPPAASQPPPQLVAEAVAKLESQRSPAPAPLEGVPRAGKVRLARAALGVATQRVVGRKVYAPTRDNARAQMDHLGEIWRKYISGQPKGEYDRKWGVLERLHETGAFTGAFGQQVGDGAVEAMSKVLPAVGVAKTLGTQIKRVGRDLVLPNGEVVKVAKADVSLALGVSGMSFPQLSASSVLGLLYSHVRLAKDGVRYLLNTGEGGPAFHLALLEGDAQKLRQQIVHWGLETGELKEGSLDHAKVEASLERLMKERDALFAEFSPEDMAKAQIVAQFGSALNGIRGTDGRIDFRKLEEVGQNPHVAMVEFKLKQAAKRGSKVDSSKMDPVAAAMREVNTSKAFHSPEVNPDLGTYEDIAAVVVATKLATHKPVSLKFAVGDVENIYDFLHCLAELDALPDQIQIDGGGRWIAPGSGNAPPTGSTGNTSLNAREATLVVDGILKRLGVRDEVHLVMAGEVLLPTDALEAMALGADGVVGARTWMNMGLGCSKVGSCNSGSCPYGIASRSGSVFSASLNPLEVGPKAYAAAKAWREALATQMGETGAMDWRVYRKTHGLHARQDRLTVRRDGEQIPLREAYGPAKVARLLGGVLGPEEAQGVTFGYHPPEQVAQERFELGWRVLDAAQTLDHTPEHAGEVEAYLRERLERIPEFLEQNPSGWEIRDFVHHRSQSVSMPGARVLAPERERTLADSHPDSPAEPSADIPLH